MSWSLDELCICGDTYEVHFGGECTRIWRSGNPCPCKKFLCCEYVLEIAESLEALVTNSCDTDEHRAALKRGEAAIRKAKGDEVEL